MEITCTSDLATLAIQLLCAFMNRTNNDQRNKLYDNFQRNAFLPFFSSRNGTTCGLEMILKLHIVGNPPKKNILSCPLTFFFWGWVICYMEGEKWIEGSVEIKERCWSNWTVAKLTKL